MDKKISHKRYIKI